ncbi:hypothetical protein [Kribbella sp. NPDC048915]|uniref:hypothetical protein n=1 Tax=Kribbella sp. NPDC048915 TaxID=3155148 RepID=UPI0033C4DC38
MSFPTRRRVRLWFGPHPIADFIGAPAAAARHEAAMRRRFPGLEVTNEPLPGARPVSGPQPTGRPVSGPQPTGRPASGRPAGGRPGGRPADYSPADLHR